MSDLIKLEEYAEAVFNEAARRILDYSPQLFVAKSDGNQDLEPLGTSVLVRMKESFYLITAAHCIEQSEGLTQIIILDGTGKPHAVRGHVAISRGPKDQFDVAAVKLSQHSTEKIAERYKFLQTTSVISPNADAFGPQYFVVGYPIRGTNVDNRRRRMSHYVLPYIVASANEEQYRQAGFSAHFNILVNFNQRKSQFVSAGEMIMAPNPQGMSGCGLWRIEDLWVKPQDVRFFLAAIMIEHDKQRNLMVGTKMATVMPLLHALADKFEA